MIEQQIGSALFLRSAAGVVPTDIGRLLVQRARQVVQMAEDLEQEVQSNRTLQSGQVTVGVGPYPLEAVLTTALARFITAHPAIGVRVQVRDWDEFLPGCARANWTSSSPRSARSRMNPTYLVEPLSQRPLYFVGRHAHPLAGRDNVTAAETFAYPFIAPARIPPRLLEPMLQARRKFAGLKTSPLAFPVLECNVLAAVKRIVESSDALTALTLSCLASEVRQRRLSLLATKPWLAVSYGIVSLKGHPMSSAALRFREFVVQAEAEVAPFEEKVLASWKSRGVYTAPKTRVPVAGKGAHL